MHSFERVLPNPVCGIRVRQNSYKFFILWCWVVAYDYQIICVFDRSLCAGNEKF